MNRLFFLLGIFLLSSPLFGQYHDDMEYRTIDCCSGQRGWYIGFHTSATEVNSLPAVLPAFSAGYICNHAFSMGFKAAAFAGPENNKFFPSAFNGDGGYFEGGYGGLHMEMKLLPSAPVHLSFPLLLGVGGAAITTRDFYEGNHSDLEWERVVHDTKPFLICEPGAELEFNICSFMRVSGGINYRFTSRFNLFGYNQELLDGFSFTGGLKFGSF